MLAYESIVLQKKNDKFFALGETELSRLFSSCLNQYPKVVNSLRGNHHRSSTVILTQNWLKTIVKNQLKQYKSHYQFCFVHQTPDHPKLTFPPLY